MAAVVVQEERSHNMGGILLDAQRGRCAVNGGEGGGESSGRLMWGMVAGLLIWVLLSAGPLHAGAVDPVLVPVGASWRYRVNRVDSQGPPPGWWGTEFDDSQWPEGRSGFGTGLGDEATVLERTNVVSACFRTRFTLEDPTQVRWLILRASYQSGLAVWVNGQEVYRAGLSQPPEVWNQTAPFSWRFYTRELDLSAYRGLLNTGMNVLAVQVQSHTSQVAALFWSGELRANLTRGPLIQRLESRRAWIAFRTPSPVAVRVRHGPADRGMSFASSSAGEGTNHLIELDGLQPGREWTYQVEVGTETGWLATPPETFRTPLENGPLRFVVIGDSGSGTLPQLQVVSCLSTAAMDLILHTGDLVYPELTRELVDLRCFSVFGPLLRRVPLYPTMGNHDVYNTLYRAPPGTPYLETFAMLTNSLTGTAHFYSFDRGDAHFVSLFVPGLLPYPELQAYALGADSLQLQWLEQDLARTDRPWRIVFMHSPMFTSGGRRYDDLNTNGVPDRVELQTWLLPVLQRYGVQVAFFGHDHVYERFRPVGSLFMWTTGGGGYTLYSLTERDPLSERFETRFHHLECELSRDRLRVVARDRWGVVFDEAEVPRVLAPRLQATVSRLQPGGDWRLRLRWNSAPGERYRVERSASALGVFEADAEIVARDFWVEWESSIAVAPALGPAGASFYRVVWLR